MIGWRSASGSANVARTLLLALVCLAAVMATDARAAKDASGTPHAANRDEPAADDYAAFLARDGKPGPVHIALRDQAVLNLPQGYSFIPEVPAKKFMKQLGNDTDSDFLGIVLPAKEDSWFTFLEFIPSGYIKDDDAKNWDLDALLQNAKNSTQKENEERRKQGIPELEVLGWVEKPHYEGANHRLVWSISARNKGSTATGSNIINYRMLMLGRQGYIAMVMVTDLNSIEAQKPIANLLLSGLSFDAGKRYVDFNATTDRVAEYGLAALIGGIVVHKLGFFALFAALAVKFAKLIGIFVIGAIAAIRKWFGRGKAAPQSPAQIASSAAPEHK
jgi:uncharacterized membrane-anchored protein